MLLTIPELIQRAGVGVNTIDAATAFARCASGDGLVVDVREPGEVEAAVVEGSTNIPRGVLEMQILSLCQQPDLPIYLHCATSVRATLAAEQLLRLGYTQVHVIGCSLKEICQARSLHSPD